MEVIRRNNVVSVGEGATTLLLAHGYGCDQTMWSRIVPTLAESHRVVTFDYVGCGRSDLRAYNPQRYSALGGYAQDVLEICEALDLHGVTFVGHSVSSMIGLLAAKSRPDRFDRVVMLCPSPRYINEEGFTWGFDREAIEGLLDMIENGAAGWTSFLAGLVVNDSGRGDLVDEFDRLFSSIPKSHAASQKRRSSPTTAPISTGSTIRR
jgi:sigma-B regulation protein RsbQ